MRQNPEPRTKPLTPPSSDLATFIRSGVTEFHRTGQGNLFPDCDTITVATRGVVKKAVPLTIGSRTARDNADLDLPRSGIR